MRRSAYVLVSACDITSRLKVEYHSRRSSNLSNGSNHSCCLIFRLHGISLGSLLPQALEEGSPSGIPDDFAILYEDAHHSVRSERRKVDIPW